MKIIISERQLKNVILREQVEETPPKTGEDCASDSPTQWNTVEYSLEDIKNGSIIKFGDFDKNNYNAIKLIQKTLNKYDKKGLDVDGKYGKGMLKQLYHYLKDKGKGVDLCKGQNTIDIGPNTLKILGLSYSVTPKNKENYILASTLVGESIKGSDEELTAILSTIKNRISHCPNLNTMEDVVLKGGQYSTWNHYNKESTDKESELYNRIANQKTSDIFNKMLKKVEKFKLGKSLPYNHYFTNTLAKKAREGTYTKLVAKSYLNNIKTSKQIGDHTFWWDENHRCE